jgi:hypothetical protein
MAVVNPRIGISVNLPQGASYDLLLVKHPSGYPEGKLEFKLYDVPRKITGIQKVAQLFIKILFTTQGTDVLNVSLGTIFTSYILGANRTGVDISLFNSLTTEVKSAESQVKAILNTVDSDPASQLREVSVLGIDTGKDYIVMYLRLVTNAGETAQVAIPFPELDLALSQS